MSTTPTPIATPAHALRQPRTVERLVTGQPTRDGAGVTLTRVLTHDLQQRLDPFLMLDAFGSDRPDDYIAGFPDHPHRGFETVTYMIAGRMRHRDSAGNEGLLENGGVQWMTAGRGLIHSELPEQEDGVMEGFQLWLNLHSDDKMQEPGYRDIPSAQIPEWHGAEATVRVIAGEHAGVRGAIQRPRTEPLFLDLQLQPGAVIEQPLPAGHHAFIYVYRGALQVEGQAADGSARTTEVPVQRMAILAQQPQADGVRLRAVGAQPVRALLIAGAPLRQPIAQYGPFVMNTREQVLQAVQDFQSGRFA
ncbi:pirin family protein [Pseudaquabacterium rugosum]|uniref:Pirin family protein n=1 Tax=Pseudaquabacterium rugosum TaxID=2984194 RepID=A0ABU9BBW5_9BURK